ncbi:MAG TPA: dienelactone hydrolase family protein [Aliidongia sp.]|nr:dienelactone hydrolase family protein [Aliidongia sp.]
MKTEDLDYRDGDLACRGYLAFDPAAGGKRPGILVVPEIFGLAEHAMERARMLAELGYVALGVDIFGDRRVAPNLPTAMTMATDIRTDANKLRARGRAALNALKALPQVDGARLASIGFCFGGTASLELARAGEPLAGIVSFHGGLQTLAPAEPGAVKAKLLVCTGADDPLVPIDQRTAFEEEMRKAGADWQLIAYSGTGHSFTNKAADGSIMPGIKYNKSADERSWTAMQSFFHEIFA